MLYERSICRSSKDIEIYQTHPIDETSLVELGRRILGHPLKRVDYEELNRIFEPPPPPHPLFSIMLLGLICGGVTESRPSGIMVIIILQRKSRMD